VQESPDSFHNTFILKQESGDSCAEIFVLVEMQQQRLLFRWAMKRTSGFYDVSRHLLPIDVRSSLYRNSYLIHRTKRKLL
jgi:hypothetical protein